MASSSSSSFSSPPPPDVIKARLKDAYDAIAPKYNAWTTDHSTLRNRYLDKLLEHLLPPGRAAATHGDSDSTGAAGGAVVYRVLELGCGAGVPVTERLLNFDFQQHQQTGLDTPQNVLFHITANDLSATQVELGQKKLGGRLIKTAQASEDLGSSDEKEDKLGNTTTTGSSGSKVEWIQADMTKLDFPDETFDAVIAMYSLIHLPRAEQEVMIRRIARWLKKPALMSSSSPGGGKGGGIMLLNFGDEASEGDVLERWLGEEKGWMYWSGWGSEKTREIIKDSENGLEVLVDEVVSEREEGVDVSFLWVIARRSC